MHLTDHIRPLAHGGGDAAGSALAHVAGGEDAGDARLQQERVARQLPALRPLAVDDQVRPGQDEADAVALHDAGHALAVGHGADEQEEGRRVNAVLLARFVILDGDPLQPIGAMHRLDRVARQHLDVVGGGDLVNEILRHALAERRGADEHRDLAGVAREEHGSLPGRVGPANDADVLAAVEGRLGQRRAVVDARPGQFGRAGHVQLLRRHAAGDDQRPAAQFRAVAQRHVAVGVFDAHAHDLARGQNLRPQPAGLGHGARGQVGPR